MQGAEDHVAGFGGMERGGDGFQIAHFADQDDVGVLAEAGAQSAAKGRGIDFHLALIDEAFLVAMQEFDGVFDGDDVLGTRRVDAVDHGRKRGGLARAGDAGDQHQAARFFADALGDGGKKELFKSANLGGNDAEHDADIAALLKDVDAEASETGGAVGQIDFGALLELLLLAVGHHAEGHVQHVLAGDAGLIGQRHQFAVHAHVGIVADLEMKVARFALDGDAQQIIDSHRLDLFDTGM